MQKGNAYVSYVHVYLHVWKGLISFWVDTYSFFHVAVFLSPVCIASDNIFLWDFGIHDTENLSSWVSNSYLISVGYPCSSFFIAQDPLGQWLYHNSNRESWPVLSMAEYRHHSPQQARGCLLKMKGSGRSLWTLTNLSLNSVWHLVLSQPQWLQKRGCVWMMWSKM